MSAKNDAVYSTRQAAEKLGVSLRTVQLWVEAGILRAWKTAGGHRRISVDSIQRLLEEREGAFDSSGSGHRFRVLVVEDEPDIRSLYSLALSNWGLPIDVTTAANGIEGLIRLGELRPDVLITDLRMPGLDGIEMLRILTRSHEFVGMEIVVVTAMPLDEVARQYDIPERVHLLEKPIPFDKIEHIVRSRIGDGEPLSH